MRHVLGVDAGATKTYALLADETGRVLSLGRGGPANHQVSTLGLAGAMRSIADAVESACGQASIPPQSLTHAAFCLAGADFPGDFALLEGGIREAWPALSFTVHNDSFAGLRAGSSRNWGVVSICGTGTNQVGISKDGHSLQVGGMGYIHGDFGGAADLGREAVRAVFMAVEQRGPVTSLVQPVLDHMSFATTQELSEALYLGKVERGLIPRLSPLVFAHASKGDQVAQEILIRMGTLLGQSAGAVIRQLELDQDDVEVVMAGSTWKGECPLMIDAFRLAVHRVAPRARLVRPRYEPVVGAWLLGVEHQGIQATPSLYAMLEATLPDELPVMAESKEDEA